MFNLVIITSAIHTCSNPLSYSNTRSAFTHEQRLQQSINTIKSVRSYIPNSYVVYVEGTVLNDSFKSILLNEVDHLHEAAYIDNILEHVNGPYKGYAENKKILSYFTSDHYKNNKDMFVSISKISGRYYMSNRFTFEVTNNKIIGHIRYNNDAHPSGIWMLSLFYTISNELKDKYIEILNQCDKDEELQQGVALEHILPKYIINNNIEINNKFRLNVEGTYGPWGSFISH
jgi:hypothetical protein